MSRVTHIERVVLATILAALMAGAAPAAVPESAESIYTRALSRERELREGPSGASLAQLRSVVALYETVVRRYPKSGYCDNALCRGRTSRCWRSSASNRLPIDAAPFD
jgi:hypothetical protein